MPLSLLFRLSQNIDLSSHIVGNISQLQSADFKQTILKVKVTTGIKTGPIIGRHSIVKGNGDLEPLLQVSIISQICSSRTNDTYFSPIQSSVIHNSAWSQKNARSLVAS